MRAGSGFAREAIMALCEENDVFYCFLALERGVTPGILATLLGAQPILAFVFERGFSSQRLLGLVISVVAELLLYRIYFL